MEKICWLLRKLTYNLLTSCTSIEQVNLPYSHIGKVYYINTGTVTFLTHILCVSSWIMGDRQIEDIYWLLMNFPDNLLTSCTSFEQVNLLSSHIGKVYYINTGIVTFLTHILCVSYWIMGDEKMEKICWLLMNFPDNLLMSCTSFEQVNLPSSHIAKTYYINTEIVTLLTHILWVSLESWVTDGYMENICWILMNFPDNLLTSCTSIDQFNLPYSHIGKIYYINTGTVTFPTHILCVSSWIMGDGRMEYIYWPLMNFPDNLLTSCTSIEQVNLPSSHIENIYYINTGIVTFLTQILWLLLNHGWRTDGIHSLTSYELSTQFAYKLHFYWSGQPTFQSHWKMFNHHQDSDIPNAHIMCLLLNHGSRIDEKDLLTSYELSR
jgi:hypothetical protein